MWRFHSDRGKEFMGEMDQWMRENLIVHTTTPGYDSQAKGIAERAIQEVTQGIRSLLHLAGAPRMLWAEAAKHFCSILNRTPRPAPDGKLVIPSCWPKSRAWTPRRSACTRTTTRRDGLRGAAALWH